MERTSRRRHSQPSPIPRDATFGAPRTRRCKRDGSCRAVRHEFARHIAAHQSVGARGSRFARARRTVPALSSRRSTPHGSDGVDDAPQATVGTTLRQIGWFFGRIESKGEKSWSKKIRVFLCMKYHFPKQPSSRFRESSTLRGILFSKRGVEPSTYRAGLHPRRSRHQVAKSTFVPAETST